MPDCQHAARILAEGEKEGHWRNAAFSYLTGIFVYLLTSGADSGKSLAGARRHILFGDDGLTLMLRDGIHPTGQRAAQELWDVTASVLLAEFEDGVLETQTAASDFSLSDLVAGERPVTFYTAVPKH